MRFKISLALLGASALAVPGAAQALELTLRCDGVATFPRPQSASANVAGGRLSATTLTRARTPDVLAVEMTESGALIRPPASAVPSRTGESEGGWRPLSDVTVTEDEIAGRFRLSAFDKPSVVIDRRTGSVRVTGHRLSYSGSCAPLSSAERRF